MKLLILGILLMATTPVRAEVHPYKSDNSAFEGLFLPAAQKNAPGIVVIHNWMGVTAETEKQAKRFQELGYNVLVADIYGAGVRPKSVKEAGELATKYKSDRKLYRERIHAALTELANQPGVNKDKLAVAGYCFGGTGAIEAARAGEKLRAIVSFHGGLDSLNPAEAANIKAKVLVLHGAIDPYAPAKDVQAFEDEMKSHKVNYKLIKYPGAVHSFTEVGAGNDISKGAAYNADADKKSFEEAKKFLASAFK